MNYESLIRSAMTQGISPEAIAKEFTDAFNKVQKEESPAAKRHRILDEMFEILDDNWDMEQFEPEDVGRIAAIVYEAQHPEWSAKDIEDYAKQMTQGAAFSAKLVGVNDVETGLDILENELKDVLAEALKEEIKSKDDKDILEEFLKDL